MEIQRLLRADVVVLMVCPASVKLNKEDREDRRVRRRRRPCVRKSGGTRLLFYYYYTVSVVCSHITSIQR
jgi:hypothetical protein